MYVRLFLFAGKYDDRRLRKVEII